MTVLVGLLAAWFSYEAIAYACTPTVPPNPADDEDVVIIDGSGPTTSSSSAGGGNTGGAGGAGGGSTGPGGNYQCFVNQTCGFGIPHVYPIPTSPSTCATCASYGEANIELEAMVYIAEFMPNCQANCPELFELTLEFVAHCEALASKSDPAFSLKHTMTYVETNPQLGRNVFSLAFLLDFIDDTSVQLGNNPEFVANGARCDVTATATLELSDGTIIESECPQRRLGFVPPRPIAGGPILEFRIDRDAAATGWDPPSNWQSDLNGSTTVAAPGQQARRVLSITNHTAEPMSISLDVTTENANDPPTVTPSGLEPAVGTWDISADNDDVNGDAFPVSIRTLPTTVNPTECLELPAVPGASEQQSDTLSDTPVTLAPGETTLVEYRMRPWPNCGCGTNGSWTAELEAQWGTTNIALDLSGNDTVDRETPPTNCATGEPIAYPSPYTCQDEGDTPAGDPCDDDDPNLPPCDGGPIGLSGGIPSDVAAGFADSHGVDIGDIARHPKAGQGALVGAVFTVTDEAKVHVTKPKVEIAGVTTSDSSHTAQRFSPEVMRLVEFFTPETTVTAGDPLNVTVPLWVLQGLGGEVQTLAKLAAGEKQKPPGAIPHSFVSLVRSQLDTSPAVQIEIMVQVTAWARDLSSGKFEPVALSSESISVIDGGVDLAFDITAPSFDTDVYQLAYDVRSYRWNDYEQDCEDSSDNDADGFSDCDDPDCANHPLCYPDGTGGSGGTGGAPPGAAADGDDDGGCGCRFAGATPAAAPVAGVLFGCLLLLGLRRRRRRPPTGA